MVDSARNLIERLLAHCWKSPEGVVKQLFDKTASV
jgi:hypothetical protein